MTVKTILIILTALAALLIAGCNSTGANPDTSQESTDTRESSVSERTQPSGTETPESTTSLSESTLPPTGGEQLKPPHVPPPEELPPNAPPVNEPVSEPIKPPDADVAPDPLNDPIPNRNSMTQEEIKQYASARGCYPSCEGAAIRRGEVPLTEQEEKNLRDSGVLSPDVEVPKAS